TKCILPNRVQFYFFSSRRRHTRFKCDWSSDVCSSDLLEFSPDHRAELTLQYHNDEHDYNSDGRVDTTDARIQGQLDVWQRQPPDTLWHPLGASNYESYEELDVKIPHFTDHAIAWYRPD